MAKTALSKISAGEEAPQPEAFPPAIKSYYVVGYGLPRRLVEAHDEAMAAYIYKELLALNQQRPNEGLKITLVENQ